MDKDFVNGSGCPDPTAFEAVKNVTKEEKRGRKFPYMPLCYIASPFSGDVEKNQQRAREFARFAVKEGYIPLVVHLMLPEYLDDLDPTERELAMFMDIVFLGKCKELWVLGPVISSGMQKEIKVAKRRRQKIRYFNENFEEVKSSEDFIWK